MNHDLLRYLLVFLGIVAVIRFSRGGRRWRRRWESFPPDQARSPQELVAIENRLATVERLEARVAELENRLDFAERLMATRPMSEIPARD
jgi:hypothetical protein